MKKHESLSSIKFLIFILDMLLETTKQKNQFPFFIGLLAGLILVTFNIIGFDFKYVPGDLGDARLNLYFLEHAHKWMTFQLDEGFWDAPFFYPEKNVIAFSDNLLGSAPFYSIFRLFGFGTYTSFQLWFVTMSVLNYTACYYFLKYVFKNHYSAAIGAIVFAFSMVLSSQLTHAQTFPRFAIPLAFYAALRFKETLSPRHFFYTIFFVVYQIYCGIYLGFMLIIPVAVYLIYILASEFKKQIHFYKDKFWWLKLGLGGIINVLILLPLMLPYSEKSNETSIDHYNSVLAKLPAVKSYFYAFKGTFLWESLTSMGSDLKNPWQQKLFVGGTAMLCFFLMVVWMVKKWKSLKDYPFGKHILGIVITSIFAFILFTRIFDSSAYYFVYHLPGFSAMRLMARIINIDLIFFAFATALAFYLLQKREPKSVVSLFLIMTCVLFLDNHVDHSKLSRYKKEEAIKRTAPLIQIMEKYPAGTVVSYEPKKKDKATKALIDGMLAAQATNLKSVNGYSGKSPKKYYKYWKNLNEDSRKIWFKHKDFNPEKLLVIKGENDFELIEN